MAEAWMTVNEVAARLRLRRNTIYEMVKRREIAYMRRGRGKGSRILFAERDVVAYEKARRVEAAIDR